MIDEPGVNKGEFSINYYTCRRKVRVTTREETTSNKCILCHVCKTEEYLIAIICCVIIYRIKHSLLSLKIQQIHLVVDRY